MYRGPIPAMSGDSFWVSADCTLHRLTGETLMKFRSGDNVFPNLHSGMYVIQSLDHQRQQVVILTD